MPKLALITGATRGIGSAISQSLHLSGYSVAANYWGDEDTAQRFHQETNIPIFEFDVSHFDQVQQGISAIQSTMGPIDILINNAGITRDSTLHKMTAMDWYEVIQTNLTGCFNTSRACIANMRSQKFGRIINISSINAQAGQYGQTNYSAAKSGLQGLTKSLALESARYNITVNTIAPGYIDTDMVRAIPEEILSNIINAIPVGRLGKPEDIVRAVEFLIAEEASFITGSTLSVNGGQQMY